MQTIPSDTIDDRAPHGVPDASGKRRRTSTWVALVGAALAAAAGAVIIAVATNGSTPNRLVEIAVDDDGMDISAESIEPGFTRFEATNGSDSEHNFSLARLNDGVEPEDVPEILASPDFSLVEESVEFFGGVNAIAPGSTYTMTVELPAGRYVLLDYGEGPEGPWFLHDGFVQMLQVTGDHAGHAPTADVEVTEADFSFEIPARVPRRSTWEVTNNGAQGHELDLVRLDPGVSAEQALDAILHGDGHSIPGEEVNILGSLSSGRAAFVEVELAPGNYLAVCFWPDAENDGMPHIMEGMSAAFVVE